MKHIPPKILEFLNKLPNLPCPKKHKGAITKEDTVRIKIMLNNATDPKSQTEREALRQYILNSEFQDMEITDADREAMVEYLRKHAPEFYRLISKREKNAERGRILV